MAVIRWFAVPCAVSLGVLACADSLHPTAPTDTDAPTSSVENPVPSSVVSGLLLRERAFTGQAALDFAHQRGVILATGGDTRLDAYLTRFRSTVPVTPAAGAGRAFRPGISYNEMYDPETNIPASIVSHSTDVAAGGGTGIILSDVTYVGSGAVIAITYGATAQDGTVIIPSHTVKAHGAGDLVSLANRTWHFSTSVDPGTWSACKVTLKAEAEYTAQWVIPGTNWLEGLSFGQAFAYDPQTSATDASDSGCYYSGPPPTPTCSDQYATNYGMHALCEYPYDYTGPRSDYGTYYPPPSGSPGSFYTDCYPFYTYWYLVDSSGNRTSDYFYGETSYTCSTRYM